MLPWWSHSRLQRLFPNTFRSGRLDPIEATVPVRVMGSDRDDQEERLFGVDHTTLFTRSAVPAEIVVAQLQTNSYVRVEACRAWTHVDATKVQNTSVQWALFTGPRGGWSWNGGLPAQQFSGLYGALGKSAQTWMRIGTSPTYPNGEIVGCPPGVRNILPIGVPIYLEPGQELLLVATQDQLPGTLQRAFASFFWRDLGGT